MSPNADYLLKISQLSLKYEGAKRLAISAIDLNIFRGELIVLMGQSGSGKSTLLRAIAGLEEPGSGSIELNGTVIFNQSTNVDPGKRNIGLVFQDYALFPHLSVKKNIAYGINHKLDKTKIVKEYLELVGLEGFENRYPHELSGGEQQRIALARTLAPKPSILLMDEPFSNLDEALKIELRTQLVKLVRETRTTAILVTHDIEDALRIADRIVVLRKGIVEQFDSPQEIYYQPANIQTAKFFGKINLIDASLRLITKLQLDHLVLQEVVEEMLLGIRPENWTISVNQKQGFVAAIIQSVQFVGNYSELKILTTNITVTIYHVSSNWQVGQNVWIKVLDPSKVCLFLNSPK